MEICVDSLESAFNAVAGGAHRLELCSALSEGGLTPSLGMYQTLKSAISVPIFVMLRPKGGDDFQYTSAEMDAIIRDLSLFKQMGADGFVFGALTADRDIDVRACETIMSIAHPLPVTFHRAFDVATSEPIGMAQKIAHLGFARLLTSGRQLVALQGQSLIRALIKTLDGHLIIVPAAGINVGNLEEILAVTSAREFHGSAKVLKQYAANGNGLKLDANDKVYVTDTDTVRELLHIYNNCLTRT